jgi:hypothetical protein
VLSLRSFPDDAGAPLEARDHCPKCGSLVVGGAIGQSADHTGFAGSLDDPAHLKPTVAFFNRCRPASAPLQEGLQVFETMPD